MRNYCEHVLLCILCHFLDTSCDISLRHHAYSWNLPHHTLSPHTLHLHIPPSHPSLSYPLSLTVSEAMPHNWRSVGSVLTNSAYSTGGIVATLLSYYIPDWRNYQLACGIICCWFIPYYWLVTS